MFSLFPELFGVSVLATVLLRGTVGTYFFLLGIRTVRMFRMQADSVTRRAFLLVLGLAQTGTGALLLLGLFTQGAALVAMATSLVSMSLPPTLRAPGDRPLFLLLFIISFSLLFLGPGPFAFDKPL